MDEFEIQLHKAIGSLLKSVNRYDDRHTEEGIEMGARWARKWCKNHTNKKMLECRKNREQGIKDNEKLRTENRSYRKVFEDLLSLSHHSIDEESWRIRDVLDETKEE